jgi:uroporphyrin-III C-methyltransferase
MNTPHEMPRGTVALVGAGPGDPDLLTVKALRCLGKADAVAYDALIPAAILDLAPAGAMMVAVGRRDGCGATPWRVHPKVVDLARAGLFVVRLKCGDPMIFGRGGEEAEALAELGIPFELVPGVTAAAGAGACGFSLTHREDAACVTFVTGHDVADARSDPARWRALAQAGGTLALYMAGRRVARNAQRLVQAGMKPSIPAACVAAAGRPEERVVTGSLETIERLSRDLDPGQPVLMLVGAIVARRDRLMHLIASNKTQPLPACDEFVFTHDAQTGC